MNNHSRFTVWLQEHFSFFKHEPLFKDLLRFLDGIMKHTLLSALSNDGRVCVVVSGCHGEMKYDKSYKKIGKCVIEQVEFIPRVGKGFSFSVVNNELSILRRNGFDPEHSPQISAAEQQELSVFMNALRKRTEEFLKTPHDA